MSIFDQDRVGKLVRCDLVHNDNNDKITGYVQWTHSMIGETVNRVLTDSNGYISGPWTVMKVDIPWTK